MSAAAAESNNGAVWVNDVHSRLNRTRLGRLVTPKTLAELSEAIQTSALVSLSGSRHAMGGQQFITDGTCLDLRGLNRVLHFDRINGIIDVEAGIQWPELIARYLDAQGPDARWGIAQKQTGADTLTIGGSLAANVHGRGLAMRPIIADVESFMLVLADGSSVRCSRRENAELFRLAIGGYGLFGAIYSVQLRLAERQKVRRLVEIIDVDGLMAAFDRRRREHCLYGDFQFSIDERSPDFLTKGVFSCYQIVDRNTPIDAEAFLSAEKWIELLHLAYTDRAEVYRRYTGYYLSTHGQVYWSDTQQLGPYLPDYAEQIATLTRTKAQAGLMISELYVPRTKLPEFLRQAGTHLRAAGVPVIYGTVRLIERDAESFLNWARESYACVIFNLLTNDGGGDATRGAFLGLIDLAIYMGGNYFLTYHRYADRARVEKCYPQFQEFLSLKKRYDPTERFQSDWYRHYRDLFAVQPP